ncbi:hypothetical protein [Streptomyces sp. NPDC057694]
MESPIWAVLVVAEGLALLLLVLTRLAGDAEGLVRALQKLYDTWRRR